MGAIIDLMYVLWIGAVNKRQIFRAGAYSIGIAAPGLFGLLEIVSDTTMAIPYLIGLACGTMGTLYFKKTEPKTVTMDLDFTEKEMQDLQAAGMVKTSHELTSHALDVLMESLDRKNDAM